LKEPGTQKQAASLEIQKQRTTDKVNFRTTAKKKKLRGGVKWGAH